MKQKLLIGMVIIAIVFAIIACGDDDDTTPTPETVATPTATPPEGTYTGTQNVTLNCTTAGADIYYTLDSTLPTASSTKYATAISISDNATLKAIAVKSGMNNSDILTVVFELQDHSAEISGAAYDVPVVKVRGNKSISATDFETATGKLQAIVNNMGSRWPDGTSRGTKFKNMLSKPDFEFIIETGSAEPAIDVNESMPVGIDYLLGLGDDDIPGAAVNIITKVGNYFT